MNNAYINVIFLMLLMFFSQAAASRFPERVPAQLSDKELERWFEGDSLLPPAHSAEMVNEGELVFLSHPPEKTVHHHQLRLVISAQSLDTGWIWMEQCHDDLDKVSQLQILFRQERIRDLQIISSKNIARSWVEKNTVQLRDVQERAQICITAWTRALVKNKDDSYSLRNGPFMRKFLDGYYPMHVSMDIDFSDTVLGLSSIQPQAQQGFIIEKSQGRVILDAWFEGRLVTVLLFRNFRLKN